MKYVLKSLQNMEKISYVISIFSHLHNIQIITFFTILLRYSYLVTVTWLLINPVSGIKINVTVSGLPPCCVLLASVQSRPVPGGHVRLPPSTLSGHHGPLAPHGKAHFE